MSLYLVVASEDKFSASDLVKSDISYRELLDTELFGAENYVRQFENYEDALEKAKAKYEDNRGYHISDASFEDGYTRVAVLEIENNKIVSVVALASDEQQKRYNNTRVIFQQLQNYIQKPRALNNQLDLYEMNNVRNILENYVHNLFSYEPRLRNVITPSPTYSKLKEFLKDNNLSRVEHRENRINLTPERIVDVTDFADADEYRNREKMRSKEKKAHKPQKEEERKPLWNKEKPRKSVEEKALEKARIPDINVGLRTIGMQEAYEDLPEIVKSSTNDAYVVLTSQVNMVELIKQGAKAVTIGGSGREVVMIDPNSKDLKDFYNELAKDIELENTYYPKDKYKTLFTEMNKHIRENFGDKKQKSHGERKSDIKKMMQDWHGPTIELNGEKRPVIPTEEVLKNQSGVCRHHATYTTYALAKMINDGDLDDGEVFLCRDKISSGGAHQWVVYRSNSSGDVWLIDSYWNVALNLSDPKDYKIATRMKYGEAAIERLMDRFEMPPDRRLNL